jgi:serine/threonine protein kinase
MTIPIPPTYTPLALADRGTKANVYTCLPNSAVACARTALRMGADKELLTYILLSRVVALKIPHRQAADLGYEIRILLVIRRQAHLHRGGACCIELVDFDGLGGWLAMATQVESCNLEKLCESLTNPMPKALLWVMITQLSGAFWFLQRVCRPGIAHEDVGLSNFLVSYPPISSPPSQQPTIMLIDFGSAASTPSSISKAHQDDIYNLCYEIKELILACCIEKEEGYREFRAAAG